MEPLADVLFVVGVALSLGLCALGYYTYREWDEPGVGAFTVFLVVLGLGGIAGGVTSLVFGQFSEPVDTYPWPVTTLLATVIGFLPWGVFGLQYTGRYTRLSRRTLGLLVAPYALVIVIIAIQAGLGIQGAIVDDILGVMVIVYLFGLVALGTGLLLKAAWEHDHIPMGGSLCLIGALFAPLFLMDAPTSVSAPAAHAGFYVLAYAVPAAALLVGLFHYQLFETTPAVGTIGERAIAREIDSPVLVADDDKRVIRCNDAAVDAFGTARDAVRGEAVEALLGHGIDTLTEQGTATFETVSGTRRYDVGVSAVTDQHGRELGWLVNLHDVTERELREQRLAVLNRVLRHNLRNKLEVVKSHAEILEAEYEDDHAKAVTESVDDIAALGHTARDIDQFVSRFDSESAVDVVERVHDTLEAVDGCDVTVSLDLPDSATVETNSSALAAALESAIDNAVSYADSTVEVTVERRSDKYEIIIADDGPGIPRSELDSLDAGTETALQHGTGLGLWQLKWAVTTMGGDLEFDTIDGTTVTFTVPDQQQLPE